MRTIRVFSLMFLLLAGLTCFAEKTEAKTIQVTPTESLQTVIDQASAQDILQLEPGTYSGNLRITKPVQIVGQPGVIIAGNHDNHVIEVRADQVTLQNLTITGSGSSSAGIYVTKNNCHVVNNKISDVFHGVQVYQGNGAIIEGNQISSFAKADFLGFGVFLNESSQNQVLHNTIEHVQDGVYVSFTSYNVIHDNSVTHARYGIHTMDSNDLQISQNRSINNLTGAMVMLSKSVDIHDNQFLHNKGPTGAGIFIFDSRNLSISTNKIMDNHQGIYLENNYDSAFFNNTIAGNNTGIEIKQVSKNNTFYGNNIIANVRQIRNLGNNSNLFDDLGQGNYWDDYRGIDVNKDGVGEMHYQSGDMFYALMDKKPELQLFFESPAVVIWNSVKKFTTENDKQDIEDRFPLLQPVNLEIGNPKAAQPFPVGFAVSISLLLIVSIAIYFKGMRAS